MSEQHEYSYDHDELYEDESAGDGDDRIDERLIYEALWRRGDLEFLLWDQQIAPFRSMESMPPSATEYVVLCARQFGKSTMGVVRALSKAIKHRDACILIIGPDTKQTRDIVNPKMRFLMRTAPPGLIRQSKSENRWYIFHESDPLRNDFSEIIIAGMNDGSSSQRGKTVQEILVEEIADVNEDKFLEAIEQDLGPALTHSKGGKIIYLTTLPPVPDHPFITTTMVKAKLHNAISIFTIDDNIALTPEQYDACVSRAGGRHTIAFRREYLCEVVRDKNRVCLPDFDETHNVRDFTLPTYCNVLVVGDWGGVRDKTAVVLYTYDYLSDLDLFWDERVFEPNTPSSVIVPELRSMEAGHYVLSRYIDAPQQFVTIDLSVDYGYHAALPQKTDWQASLNTLNVRFQQRRALIHPRCKFLIQSANSGILNKSKSDFDRNEALGHMDGVAAMMYAVRMTNRDNPYPFVPDQIILSNQLNRNATSSSQLARGSDIITSEQINPARLPPAFGKFKKR